MLGPRQRRRAQHDLQRLGADAVDERGAQDRVPREHMLDRATQDRRVDRAVDAELPLLEAETRRGVLHREEQALHRRQRIDVLEIGIARDELRERFAIELRIGEIRRRQTWSRAR